MARKPKAQITADSPSSGPLPVVVDVGSSPLLNDTTPPPFLQKLRLTNFLSFDGTKEFEFQRLNVLIGPNGAGKSNVIEALRLLRGCVTELSQTFAFGGGFIEYLRKGIKPYSPMHIGSTTSLSMPGGRIEHDIDLRQVRLSYEVVSERVKVVGVQVAGADPRVVLNGENGLLKVFSADQKTETQSGGFGGKRSVLEQNWYPQGFPHVYELQLNYNRMQFFGGWPFGPYSPARQPNKADIQGDVLLENLANFSAVVGALQGTPAIDEVEKNLRELYPSIKRLGAQVQGGLVHAYVEEEGTGSITTSRLSDGTLHYLALLLILFQPNPPPLICIEEPELGLHPDMQAKVAKLLVEASARTQLIVTTHSEMIVGALSDRAESVIVCEKNNGVTELNRLKPEKLKHWLEKYTLGDLWMKGHIGGTRW